MKKLISIFFLFVFTAINQLSAQGFDKKHILSTGGFLNLTSYTTSDIDNDGDIDVLATDSQENHISFFENTGNGIFAFEDSITARRNLTIIKTSDIDMDGDLDLILGWWDMAIGWKENLGNMNFADYITITANIQGLSELHICDINNDSLPDFVFSATSENHLACCINLNNGNFSDIIVISDTTEFSAVQCVDLDTDNDLDILALESETNKIIWLENDGTGNVFNPHIVYFDSVRSEGTGIHAFDYDNDDQKEICLGFKNDFIWLLENDGQNNFELTLSISDDNRARSIKSFDYNNDSLKDIIFIHEYSTYPDYGDIKVLINMDSVFIRKPVNLREVEDASDMEFANLDEGPECELVVSVEYWNNPHILWLQKDSSSVYLKGSYVSSQTPKISKLFLANINGDDKKDLYVIKNSSEEDVLFLNTDENLTSSPTTILKPLRNNDGNYMFYDFNNDGYEDVLFHKDWPEPDQFFIFCKNNQDFTFDTIVYDAPNTEYSTFYLNDYNNNGFANLINKNGLNIYLYNCYSNFSLTLKDSFSLVEEVWSDLLLEDIDNDGCNDMITQHSYTSNKIRFYYGENQSCFAKNNVMPTNYESQILFPAHLNNDDNIDFYYRGYPAVEGWLENLGNQYFVNHNIDKNIGEYTSYPIDIDNNGIDEVILQNEGQILVLGNISSGGEILNNYDFGEFDDGIVYDIDYDGDLDFIIFSRERQECAWLENNLISTNVQNKDNNNFLLYPNPATNKLNINTEQKIRTITITNLIGQRIMNKYNPGYCIDISELNSGIYIVCISNYETTIIEKLVVKK